MQKTFSSISTRKSTQECVSWWKRWQNVLREIKSYPIHVSWSAAPILLLTPDKRSSTARQYLLHIYHVKRVFHAIHYGNARDFGPKVIRRFPSRQRTSFFRLAHHRLLSLMPPSNDVVVSMASKTAQTQSMTGDEHRWLSSSSFMCNLTIKEMSNGKMCNVKCTWRCADKCIPHDAWLETQRSIPASRIFYNTAHGPMTHNLTRDPLEFESGFAFIWVSEHTAQRKLVPICA